MYKFKVIGLREEYYINQTINRDDDSNKGDSISELVFNTEFSKYTLCLLERVSGLLYELSMFTDYCEDDEGHLIPSYNMSLEMVTLFKGGYNYSPKEELLFDLRYSESHYINNDVFTYSQGNPYCIHKEKFERLTRSFQRRPVWLFIGDRGVGKSYIASHLVSDVITVYETDSNKLLPDHITANVIVLGNKYQFDIDDIKKRIFGTYNLITVVFTKEEEGVNSENC